MSRNQNIIKRIIELIPQYPKEIGKKELCDTLGISYMSLNSYLCSATYMALIGESNETLTRCEEWYA